MTPLSTSDFRSEYQSFMVAYLSTLRIAKEQNLPLQMMEVAVHNHNRSLGYIWSDLIDACIVGCTPQDVCYRLSSYMQEWASLEANALIVRLGRWVDPQDQNVQEAFWNQIEPKCEWLLNELRASTFSPFDDDLIELDEEEEDDRAAADHLTQQLKPERLLPQPSTTHPISSRSQNRQQVQPSVEREFFDMLRQAHDDSRESLQMAIEATRETRQAITGMVGPVTELLKSASQYAPYEAPAKPVHRAMRRITFVVILGLVILALFALVYIGLHYLY